jgi:hypothetical protein
MINMSFLRGTSRLLSAFIGALIFLIVAGAANAQSRLPFVSGACYNANQNDPQAIASCMATDSFPYFEDDCSDAYGWFWQSVYYDRLDQGQDVGSRRDFFANNEITTSCSELSEARALFSGEPFPWAACIPNGSEGTVEHMTACLRATRSFPRNAECRAVYDAYDAQVLKGIPSNHVPSIPRQTLSPGEEKVFEGRSQTFRIIQSGMMNYSYVLRLDTRPRDCTVAAQVVENFLQSGPTWSACTGYTAAAVPRHFANCVASTNSLSDLSRMSCVDQRARYEELLTSANLRLPESYRPITCPQIEEGLVLAQQTVAEERAAATAQPEPAAPEAEPSTGQSIGLFISRAFILVLLIASFVGAVGFAVVASLRDVRKIPYKRQMWRAYGVSVVVWAVAAYLTPAISYAIDSQFRNDIGPLFWGLFTSYATVGSIGFFGVRLLFGGKHKPPQREQKVTEDGFVEAKDDGHILHEDATTTALIFYMWKPNVRYPTHGRIIEIRPDKFTVSPIQKVKRPEWRGPQFKEWYDSGEWSRDAKVYDPQKISTIRLVSESRIEDQNVPPLHVLIMDYGTSHVELNIKEGGGFFDPWIGHISQDQERYVRLTKLIAETLQRRRDGSETVYEDPDIKVTFEGLSEEEAAKAKQEAEDRVNKILGGGDKPTKQPPTHDDPF